jgi:hypothetical protein
MFPRNVHVCAALAALAASTLGLGNAKANMAAVSREPSRVSAGVTIKSTRLTVESVRLLFDCGPDGKQAACRFEARYRVANRSAEAEDTTAAFYGVRTSDVGVQVDGKSALHALEGDESKRLDDAIVSAALGSSSEAAAPSAEEAAKLAEARAALSPDARAEAEKEERERAETNVQRSVKLQWGPDVSRTGFVIHAEPGQVLEVVATGTMHPGRRSKANAVVEPLMTRHMLTRHDDPTEPKTFDFDYFVAPIRTWQGKPPVDVEVRSPLEWSLRAHPTDVKDRRSLSLAHGSPEPTAVTLEHSVRDGRRVSTARIDAASVPNLSLELVKPEPSFTNGGPYLGIGGAKADAQGFRLRAGWEVAGPTWLLYSMSVETDLSKRLTVAPLIEAATPWILYLPIVPSLSGGVGPVLQVLPDTRAGVRLQGTAAMPALGGFVTSVDLLPGTSKHPYATEVTLLYRTCL